MVQPYLPIQVKSHFLALGRANIVCFCIVIFKSLGFLSPAEFVPPSLVRSARRKEKGEKYKERKLAQQEQGIRRTERKREEDPLAVAKVFS